jgi:hypothetical protein
MNNFHCNNEMVLIINKNNNNRDSPIMKALLLFNQVKQCRVRLVFGWVAAEEIC